MSDIIANAQRLLKDATPEPWSLGESEVTHRLLGGEVYEYGGEPVLVVGGEAGDVSPSGWGDEPPYCYDIHRVADGELMAASLEMAQELAKETWEYAVQVKRTESEEWRLLSFKLPFITHKTTWFSSQSEAEHERQEQVPGQVNSRIVRRRVSPLEVIDE
ncbi:MAG: hypothetical protein HLX50_00420 [Alteromonadaceae bacterium]|nr:hypothetical protein [Alteromonadaceae bacterium]